MATDLEPYSTVKAEAERLAATVVSVTPEVATDLEPYATVKDEAERLAAAVVSVTPVVAWGSPPMTRDTLVSQEDS